jgi:predicted metal-binding protein
MGMSRLFRKRKKKEIEQSLLALRDEAYELGASKAAVVDPKEVVVDDRVLYKCIWACNRYNRSLMCPPYTPKPEDARKLFSQYRYALIVRKKGRPEDFAGTNAREENRYGLQAEDLRKLMLKLESSAFYKGYYLALSLVGGCCKICHLDGICEGIEEGICRHPFESRPSMESLGIDVLATLDNLGWKVQVVGRETEPEEIEEVGYVGLLLVC